MLLYEKKIAEIVPFVYLFLCFFVKIPVGVFLLNSEKLTKSQKPTVTFVIDRRKKRKSNLAPEPCTTSVVLHARLPRVSKNRLQETDLAGLFTDHRSEILVYFNDLFFI
jgi:hypothetical protein